MCSYQATMFTYNILPPCGEVLKWNTYCDQHPITHHLSSNMSLDFSVFCITIFYTVGVWGDLTVMVENNVYLLYVCLWSHSSIWFSTLFTNCVPFCSDHFAGDNGDNGIGVVVSRVDGALGVHHHRSWAELAGQANITMIALHPSYSNNGYHPVRHLTQCRTHYFYCLSHCHNPSQLVRAKIGYFQRYAWLDYKSIEYFSLW